MFKIISIFLFLLCPIEAFAYLDPGIGSILLQSTIAAIVGGYYGLKLYWSNLKLWFKKIVGKHKNGDQKK